MNTDLKRAKEKLLEFNKTLEVGRTLVCPFCGKSFIKKDKQLFCSTMCEIKYKEK